MGDAAINKTRLGGLNLSEKVRVGVVGTSKWWADWFHLPKLKDYPRAEVTAICGRNRERVEELAKKYEIPSVFTDYREMIEKGGLEALVVLTPDDLHYPLTMAALDAGLHVLCEKPLALNASQAREMYAKAEAVGVKHMVFFTYRWLPHYQYLKTLIDAGYIGRCFHCHMRYEGGYGRANQYGWRFDGKRGNGILGDLGSHMIHLAQWYLGDVVKVSAHLGTFVERSGPEGQPFEPANDSASLTLQFANGAHGTMHVSAVAHVGERGQEQEILFHGEAGTLEAQATYAGEAIRGARAEAKEFEALPVPDSFWGAADKSDSWSVFDKQPVGVRLFIDAILDDRPVSPNFYDGLKVQEVIDAAVESQRKGAWVSLP